MRLYDIELIMRIQAKSVPLNLLIIEIGLALLFYILVKFVLLEKCVNKG